MTPRGVTHPCWYPGCGCKDYRPENRSRILEARSESESQVRREEAQVWFDKWRQLETLDPVWASNRLAELQSLVENTRGNTVMMALTKEWAEGICKLADDDARLPLVEAKHRGVSLAHLKEIATAWCDLACRAKPEVPQS